ncbi:MAG TPA: histone deacetylase [Pirellulales bacterium]
MKLYYSDTFVLPLPDGHSFPMAKYVRLRERLEKSGLFAPGDFLAPPRATDEQLELAHTRAYIERVANGTLTAAEQRSLGFPWSPYMDERARRSVGASIAALQAAWEDGTAANLAGGTHHAFADRGEGYCVFNDAVVAARVARTQGLISRTTIIDCDVHQGNGTAALAADDEALFAFSIHGRNNYPVRKEKSDLDVELPDGIGDDEYLKALGVGVRKALDRGRPDAVIYLAGADPYEHDRFGRMKLTKDGLLRRDELVFRLCRERGLPVALAMAGGYARNVDDVVDIHYGTVALARQMWSS